MQISKLKSIVENVQLYPSDNFKITIDNLTRKAFEMCIDGGENVNITLNENNAKNIKSKISISNLDKLNVKFTEFHWAVFDACTSIIRDGNEFTTLAILRRKLGGARNKNNREDLKLDQAIKDALEDLSLVKIVADMEDTKKLYNPPLKSGKYKFNGYILPNESLEMSVNGQNATLIHFISKSILFTTSEMKDQIITCEQELFEPPIRMTPRSIAINHFLLRRVKEMIGSRDSAKSNKRIKPLRHTILLESLYKACGLETATRTVKQNVRQNIEKILNYFVKKDLIKGYEFKIGKAGQARTIHFQL